MRHIPVGARQLVLPSPSRQPSPEEPSSGADPFGKQASFSPTDLQSRYLVVKSVSGSPLRDDLELCLAELDALIAIAEVAPVVTYLHFEMEERRIMIIDALQSGFEL